MNIIKKFPLSCFILLFYCFSTLVIIFAAFPVNKAMANDENFILETLGSSESKLLDTKQTKGSIFYFAAENDKYLIIHVEKSPFAPKYRILHPITIQKDEILEESDFFHQFKISLSGQKIHIEQTAYFNAALLLWMLWGVVCFILFLRILFYWKK